MKIALPFAKNASAASRERTLRAVAALGALLLAACGNNTTQVSAANAEGLVKIKAHSGAWVSGLDQEEFEQCYKLREVVEPMVIGESVPLLNTVQLDRIAELADLIDATGGAR